MTARRSSSTRDGPVATLTLNRPESLNALDFALMDALSTPRRTSRPTTRCASS